MKPVNFKPILFFLFTYKLFGCLLYPCQAAEDRKVPYNTYVFLGAPKTGKSSFVNIFLNYLKEQNEGVGIQENIAPAWQKERPSGKDLTSETIEKESIFRVNLGRYPSSDIGLSSTHTNAFNAYVYPFGRATIVDTQGLEFEHINDSAKTLKQSLNSLDASIGVSFAQGVIFISVPPEDVRLICMEREEGFSSKFDQQILSLRRLIKKLPPRLTNHFSVILTPDYDDIPQNEIENTLRGLQAVASGASSYREKISRYISNKINISLSPNQIFALDSGDALLDLLNPGEVLQSRDNAMILSEALEYLDKLSIHSIMWASENSEQSPNKNSKRRNDNSLQADINKLISQSIDIEFLSRRTKESVNRFRQSSNALADTFAQSSEIALNRRPATVELSKLTLDTTDTKSLTVHSSFKDEISLTGFKVDSYQYGLDDKGEFFVQKKVRDDYKFNIQDVSNIPTPSIKQRIISDESDPDLKYELHFSYDSYPEIVLELKYLDFLADDNLLANSVLDGAVSFHNRGNLPNLLDKGNPVNLPVLTDSFYLQGSEEVSLQYIGPEELSRKRATFRQCCEILDTSKILSRECKNVIEQLGSQVSELSGSTNKLIEKISKKFGSNVCGKACYHLCYFDKSSQSPLNTELETASYNTLKMGYRNTDSAVSRFETSIEKEKILLSKEIDSKIFPAEGNDYEYLISKLSEPMRESLMLLKGAFERKEIVSYDQGGKLRYLSSSPEHLVAIYNLSLIPSYSIPRSDQNRVTKYLDIENQEYFKAIFSIKDQKKDLLNRIEPRRKLNILLFGPKRSGKSTLANFFNHFAGTIDANRMDAILERNDLEGGPESGFMDLWGQAKLEETLAGTWVKHYFPKSLQLGPLRARIASEVPSLFEEDDYFGIQDSQGTVPVYRVNNDFQNTVNESIGFGTMKKGNLIDSFHTQAPFIEPLYRLNTLDTSGFEVRVDREIPTGVKTSRVLSAIETFKQAGYESIDALCLVLDGAKFMNIDNDGHQDQDPDFSSYFASLKHEISQVIKAQKELNLPIHVVFTHAREIFPYQDSYEEKQASFQKLRELLEKVLDQSHLSRKVHVYAMDFLKLWSPGVLIKEKNKDFRRCLYESNRLLSNIYEDKSQGISITLAEFEGKIRDLAQNRASNIRLSFRGEFFDAANLRLESSSNSRFEEDIEPILIEGNTLATKVKDLVVEDLKKVHEPNIHRNQSLPYLVGVVVKGKHPNVTAEKVEIFPLHHVYKLTNPATDYPWITSNRQLWDINMELYKQRLEELRCSFADYQAQRIVEFIEDVDLSENDKKILFVQIGSDDDTFKLAYTYNGYTTYLTRGYYYGTEVRTFQADGSLIEPINRTLSLDRDLSLHFRSRCSFSNGRDVHLVIWPGGSTVSLKRVDILQDLK